MGSDAYHPHDIDRELTDCCLDCRSGQELVKQHLLAFHDRIAGAGDDAAAAVAFDDVYSAYSELDDVVRLQGPGDHLVGGLLADPEVRAILPDLRAAYARFFARHETDFAHHLLGADDPWAELEGFVFYPNYVALTDTEARLAGLAEGRRVVFIGCGPLPLTNILLAARHGLVADGIEMDPDTATLARALVELLGLRDSIRIIEGDHRFLTAAAGYDLVMVAAQANSREQVLEYLRDEMPAGTRISFRVYEKGLRRILADDVGWSLPEGLTAIGIADPGPAANNTVILAEVAGQGGAPARSDGK